MAQLSKKQKKDLIAILKMVDVKEMEINHADEEIANWFRFGSYNGLQIACEVIKGLPEAPSAKVS